jgi:SAM-dependent methyltransferase
MLHFAPEPFLSPLLMARFREYETADLEMKGVNHKVDIRKLPFADKTYDFIYASHVLEHVREDSDAIAEIRRVLKPGGVAILPVPIVASKTVEYPDANPFEGGHVRAPGPDYFEKYKKDFSRVEVYSSDSFTGRYQLFVYEDRTAWPSKDCPLRPPMPGEKHADFVPVCYA